MGHESQIEPWLPLTTVLLVSFRADWLRREGTMKTATRKENRNYSAAVFNVGLEARETLAVRGEDFPLGFPFYRTSV
jgi:hypothetical protein